MKTFCNCIVEHKIRAPHGGTGRLIGGTMAAVGQFPFIPSVSRNDQHLCAGFIYNEKWVVTSAKCIYGKPKEEFKVLVGALSFVTPDPGEQSIGVFDMVYFPQYDDVTQKHDVALIEVSKPILFGPTTQPMPYGEIDELAQPWDAKIVGWGATFEDGLPSTRLRWGPIDNLAADCSSYDTEEYIESLMICAGSSSGVSPCEYDEGTPLTHVTNFEGIQKEVIIGIMSKNQGCSNATIPTIYTRLPAYSSWLVQTAGPQASPNVLAPQL
ncbi:complement factor D-like [Daphnia carinata]|uniref:complement factor D-like n=1 Tax=Daphnia carinata TaxID=120202 RepID=UPI00257AC2E5|nr:complement factor D-like [Daphnia carinata]